MHKFLIIGLGNPGSEFTGTRHNIGFEVLDAFIQKHQGMFTMDRLAAVAEVKWRGKTFICVKPSTYMNLSGKAVRYWLDMESVSLENMLVIVDDVALPLDRLRLRPTGSSGGHNGLKSIEESLQTGNYPKLRFGIGSDYPKGRQVDYVLGRWNANELPLVTLKISKCVELIESFAQQGLALTMNECNNLKFLL